MKTNSVAPIKKQIVVEAARERAFRVFTQNIDSWWPREYQIGKARMQAAVLEPKTNGRWYERGEDGSECDWGKVIAWEPPQRLVLAWNITAQWQYDPELATEIEVQFIEQGPTRTLVELTHRHLERHGDAAQQVRDTFEGGWGGLLEKYRAAAQQGG